MSKMYILKFVFYIYSECITFNCDTYLVTFSVNLVQNFENALHKYLCYN